ncbi:MAG TPA: CAP domain-containing protein [Candidatus Binataceae bacterium]
MPTPKTVRRRSAIKVAMGLLAFSLAAVVAGRVYLIITAPVADEYTAGVTRQESAILDLVNRERARAGKSRLEFSPRLAVVARGHSYDMAIRHYLSHASPEGAGPADRIRGVGIAYQTAGENIYVDDYRDLASVPERAVARWLDSPEHRENMLSDKYTETGVGIARSSDGNTYVTQDFIR